MDCVGPSSLNLPCLKVLQIAEAASSGLRGMLDWIVTYSVKFASWQLRLD